MRQIIVSLSNPGKEVGRTGKKNLLLSLRVLREITNLFSIFSFTLAGVWICYKAFPAAGDVRGKILLMAALFTVMLRLTHATTTKHL